MEYTTLQNNMNDGDMPFMISIPITESKVVRISMVAKPRQMKFLLGKLEFFLFC